MLLHVQKTPFTCTLLDESGKALAKIRRRFFGAEQSICNAAGEPVYTAARIHTAPKGGDKGTLQGVKYQILQNGRLLAGASVFSTQKDGAGAFTLRPARADKMEITGSFGKWTVCRQRDDSFLVSCKDTPLGSISAFGKPQRLQTENNQNLPLWAAVYALTRYMAQEDDVEIL